MFWESNLLSNLELAFPLGIQWKANNRYGCSFKGSLANCSGLSQKCDDVFSAQIWPKTDGPTLDPDS
jgi:hypothetical protein